MRTPGFLSLTLFLATASAPAQIVLASTPVEITECGAITDAPDAFLSADLDCADYEGKDVRAPIVFLNSVVFDLRGFTLTGWFDGCSPARWALVDCRKDCTVTGGGGSLVGGCWGVASSGRAKIKDATLRDMTRVALHGQRRAAVENVTVIHAGKQALESPRRSVVRSSLITENGGIPEPGTGEVQKTSTVVEASSVRVYDSVIVDNGWTGAEGSRVRLKNSTVTGNGTYYECGVTRNCKFDVGSERRPRVQDSICDISLDMASCACDADAFFGPVTDPATHNWGVCALD